MSKSTRLASATYILSYIAAKDPDLVTTEEISRVVEDHPARVRQLVAGLVKSGLVESIRGANGGIRLAKKASEIDLRQVYSAVADQPLVSIAWKEPIPNWGAKCHVQPNLEHLYEEVQETSLAQLSHYTLADMLKKI